ncbi:MAG: alpha/beta hydrolase [Phaeodactylibacter sp.]|nr:alpha/beta hydrolase [Phaeodactylibacter sp.]MCB9048097.1 alpha/beta hydrolase [Lewinellaceae bacterium]
MKRSILFFVLLSFSFMMNAQDIEGAWNGVLEVQDIKLRLVLHITAADGGYTGSLDSPDQGATGIPVDEVAFSGDTLTVKAAKLGLQYVAVFDEEKQRLEGTFEQGGMQIPLRMAREAVEVKKEPRPQDPKDFPYLAEEVSFSNESDGVTLAGTLTLPEDKKVQAVVVLISGSGPQDRNEEVGPFNHRPFLVLSDYLTRQGIGVLRYDDRGVGGSSGDRSVSTTYDYAEDAAAAVAFLRGRPDLKGAKVGLVGHSEGGMIAPIVATELAEVDFLVLLAGPGMPIDELLLLQSALISRAQGVPEDIHQANEKVLKEAYSYLKENTGLSADALQAGLESIFVNGLQHFPEETQKEIGDPQAFAREEATSMMSPWFLYFIRFDPAVYLSRVKAPVLALNGTLDLQVPAEENLAGIKKALGKAGNNQFEAIALEGLNHLFQQATTGSIEEYREIEETFNEGAMQTIVDWIRRLD